MYYLIPLGTDSNEPYALLEAAMEKKGRWGVGQVVFSGREQLAVVRPLDGVLMMAMLNYDAEIRKPSEIEKEFTRAHTTARKLHVAEELVGKWHEGKFDFSEYKDRYRQKVKQAIEAKQNGEDVTAPEEEEPEVINLMEALQRSIAGKTGEGRTRRASSKTKLKHHESNGRSQKSRRQSQAVHRRRA